MEDHRKLLEAYKQSRHPGLLNTLVVENLALVRYLCRRFSRSAEPREDLFQVGVVGLLKAIEKFDLARGNGLAAFATPLIIGEILNYFRDHGRSIKVPRKLQQNHIAVQRAVERLTQDLGRWPTAEELAHTTELSEEEVYETFEVERNCRFLSLDESIDPEARGEALEPANILGKQDNELEYVVERMALRTAMTCLDPREDIIIRLKFFKSLTQKQIADRMGISQMHVSRLQRSGLAKLRRTLAA